MLRWRRLRTWWRTRANRSLCPPRSAQLASRLHRSSLGISQLVLLEDRLPRGDHLFQDVVQKLLATTFVPDHKQLDIIRCVSVSSSPTGEPCVCLMRSAEPVAEIWTGR